MHFELKNAVSRYPSIPRIPCRGARIEHNQHRYCMMGISLFALGGLSTIYYRAAYQVLRIDGEFEGAFARMIVSRMALWQLKEEFEKDPTDSNLGAAVDISRINKVLSDAYELDLQMGDLTKHDVHQMARLMMTSMDFSRDGLVELSEFLQATSSNESVRA